MNQEIMVAMLGAVLVGGSLILLGGAAQEPSASAVAPKSVGDLPPSKETYLALADEVDAALRRDVLDVWFPRTVDAERGGFHSEFARDWTPGGDREGKFSVFQGRMTWVAAQIVMRRPELKQEFLPVVQHGVRYLNDTLWDRQYGGFYWGLDNDGRVSSLYTDGKHMYGNAFALYAVAAAYQSTKDPKALELAQKAFLWIDERGHDTRDGGYFEWLTRAGKVVEGDPQTVVLQPVPVAGFPIGYKSMNTHIHLLEAFTQLYQVWPDERVRQRLQELLAINRDRICVPPGVMNLYFTNDWRAIPGLDSYGHDVETAYLLLEAEEVLGRGHDPKTERMARRLVDHALAYGWDKTFGGFYQDGPTFGEPASRNKEWWVQLEGLNALLLMHERYGGQTDEYFKAFQQQWRFISHHQIDGEFHGVYEMVGPDGKAVNTDKGRIWKAAYHDSRTLLNVSERLRHLASAAK